MCDDQFAGSQQFGEMPGRAVASLPAGVLGFQIQAHNIRDNHPIGRRDVRFLSDRVSSCMDFFALVNEIPKRPVWIRPHSQEPRFAMILLGPLALAVSVQRKVFPLGF